MMPSQLQLGPRAGMAGFLAQLNSCYLSFDGDSVANINRLTQLCGELLGADCALYNRLEDGLLIPLGSWNAPADLRGGAKRDGRICDDVIRGERGRLWLVRDLPRSPYSRTDSTVSRFGLKTYVGMPVQCAEEPVGVLCLLYREDFQPSAEERTFIGIISAAIGIEESRRRAQEAQQQQQQTLEAIIGQSDSLVFIWRVEPGRWPVQFVSGNVSGILGYTPDDFLSGRVSWPGITHPEDVPRLEAEVAGHLEAGDRSWSQQYRLIMKSGGVRWFRDNNRALADASGKIIKIQAVIHDITEHRKAEEALRETKESLENLIAFANSPIIVWDPELRITRVNRAFEALTGRSAEEIIGKDLQTLIPSGLTGNLGDLLRETLGGKRWQNVEIRIPHLDGTLRTVLWNSATILGPDGKTPSATIAQGQDVTERNRYEKDLMERNEELTRFTYAVSHDLKSPLVTVQTFLGYLETDLGRQDAAGVGKDLGYIRNAADKMSRLLDELLDLARVGRKTSPATEASLQEVVWEALSLAAGRIAARSVRVVVTQERVILRGDQARLVEVFLNLVDNAVKFMGEQPRPRIEVGVETRAGQAVFFVRDNGIGVDPRHQGKIFGLFEKLDPGTEGTGMGLTLARRIVEVHGGRMWLESDGLGSGATFLFTLAEAKRPSSREGAT